jgi:Uma2 family endonuclease
MDSVLRLTPEVLPRTLRMDPPVSDSEFEALCRDNDSFYFERTKEGAIRMNPPAGGWTSDGNAEIVYQLRGWWATHKRGRVFESSAAFRLPDGSILSPDAAYLSDARLRGLAKGALKGFPRVCPDFVIELLSESDSLPKLQAKMADWMENGVLLGWLIDPYGRRVHTYQASHPPQLFDGLTLAGQGPVEGFMLDLNPVWSCYEE